MISGAVADRFRPPPFVPFLKNKSHTWQLWFARSPTLWRSIPETTLLPANPERKIAEHRSVVAGQDGTLPATACARQSSLDTRACPWDSSKSSMFLFLHRLRFDVGGIGVIQPQPRNLIHVQVRKGAHVVAAEGASHQNAAPANASTVKRCT